MSLTWTMTPLLVPSAFLKSRSRTKSSYDFSVQRASSLEAVITAPDTVHTPRGKMASDKSGLNRAVHPASERLGRIKGVSCAQSCPVKQKMLRTATGNNFFMMQRIGFGDER